MLHTTQTNVEFDKNLTQKLSIAIVRTNYYPEFIDNMENSCREVLMQQGVPEANIQTFIAPGSWEIPVITQAVAKTKKFDAIVTFGLIIKGETYHFEMLANESARGLMQLSLDHEIPIAMEVLAVYNVAQAEARAGKGSNKGGEGALAVLKTLETLRKIR